MVERDIYSIINGIELTFIEASPDTDAIALAENGSAIKQFDFYSTLDESGGDAVQFRSALAESEDDNDLFFSLLSSANLSYLSTIGVTKVINVS